MARISTLLCIVFLLSPATWASGKLYKHVDANGHVRYTDRPAHDGYVELKLTLKGWKAPETYANYKANRIKYTPLLTNVSQKHGLPGWLVAAVIHAESLYNPQAVSSAGAVGLMQLMPGTAQRYGVYNRQNPEQNIEAGVRYLSDLLDMFDNNLDLALAAYNAGENAVKRYGYRIPPYKETRNYVRKVKALSLSYKSNTI